MDRINTHSTNRDGLLLLRSESRSASGTTSSASQFVLQWGGQKRLRHSTSNDPTGSRTGRRATARIDHRLVKSDTNDNSGEDPSTNRQTLVNFVRSAGGHLNLRQRPASPSSRILRSSEGSIGMKGLGNGVMDRKVPPINTNNHNKNTSNNIITNCSKNNNVNNSHHNKDNHRVAGGVGSGSPEAVTAIWPPKFVIALTNKEKEEDFMAIKGSKLPQRPKKRAKFIQRTLNLVSPGAWLCDLTLERYEVREKKVSKKRPRGLKAMGNMDSDSE